MSELQKFISSRIPKGWDSRPLWSLFRRRKITGCSDEELLSVYRDYGVIPKSSRDDNYNKESDDLSSYQLVTEGALVTNKMKAWQGSIAISRYQGIVSPAYYVYEPLSDENDQFLHYLLRSKPYVELYGRISKGVRVNQWDLEHEALRTVPIMLPDRETQKAIADFLDRETDRIDQLIEKKSCLDELVQKKRCTLISLAVSGRLGSQKVMPSSSRWFDLLPADWSLMKLNWLARRIGDGLHSTPQYDDDGDYFFINGNNLLRDAVIIKDGTRKVGEEEYKKHYISLDESTLLLSINGTIGNVGLYNGEPVILGKSAAYVKCSKNIRREYLSLVMQSEQIQNYFSFEVTGTTIYNLSLASIRNLPVPLPPTLEQQNKIVKDTNQKLSILDDLTHKNAVSIDRLGEFRTALITAAVTGQIDLASWGKQEQTERRLERIEEDMSLREARA